MPLHSIIIPAFNRDKHLAVCLASIEHSAHVCNIPEADYEILIIEGNPPPHVELGPNEPMPYHKTAALNRGLDAAHGSTLSFLDADAVVTPRWFENLPLLEDDSLTKLAYRVRYADYSPWPDYWLDRFACYECGDFPVAFEAYGQADANAYFVKIGAEHLQDKYDTAPVFGNSHFSIRRDKLGDLRFDERYIGRGYEDLDMNRRIAENCKEAYRCELVADGPHAVFNIKHAHSPGFDGGSRWNNRNRRLYYGEAKVWYVCPDCRIAEFMQTGHPHAEVTWPPNDRWALAAAIPDLDIIIRLNEQDAL